MTTPTEGSDPAAMFTPVAGGRVPDAIVDRILTVIDERQLAVGDRLPTERELTTMFATSRTSLREALRVLESRGLLVIKVGSRGGAFVAAPSPVQSGQGMRDLMAVNRMTPRQVTEARIVLEIGAMPMACERARPEDIADLTAICEHNEAVFRGGAYAASNSFDFHLRLIACAKNPALDLLVGSLREPFQHSLTITQERPDVDRTDGLAEHRDLVGAVADRDAERAVAVMRRHLARTYDRSPI